MATLFISEHHRLRGKAERFIREVYEQEYGARLRAFPASLFAAVDFRGEILCAAGFRSHADGFFSERYLDCPVDTALTRLDGRVVRRDRVFEISTFASRSPHSIPSFVSDLIDSAEAAGFEWGFFTLTRRLRLLLDRLGLELERLGPAEAARIEDAFFWGSYYEQEPEVYAGNRDSLRPYLAARRRQAVNA
ncbi:MAG TPA: thermostable hemolysin [Methylocystis sp.]|nr:thermostable hemolysin [Methylocystis sp.]